MTNSIFSFIRNIKNTIFRPSDGRYGLALENDGGQPFIIVLVALMSFLAVLTLSASFSLSHLAESWSSGMERKITLEIPAIDVDGNIREDSDISNLKNEIKKTLHDIDYIDQYQILKSDDVYNLILPWLGESDDDTSFLNEIPVPTLIAVELQNTAELKNMNSSSFQNAISNLTETLIAVDPTIKVDTHKEWLADFLQLISILRFSTLFVALVVAVSAVTAVSGTMRSHIAEYKPDIELLHLIGASDLYIAKQFENYALRLGLLGGIWGLGIGFIVIFAFKFLSAAITTDSYEGLIPNAGFGVLSLLALFTVPGIACLLCALSARITVLRSLSRMP